MPDRAVIRLWPYAAAVAVVLAAIFWVDHRGYQRAKQDAEVAALRDEILARRRTDRIEQAMADAIAKIDGNLADRIAAIRTIRQAIQPVIERETIREPRYRDPACAVTGSVLDAINRARAATDPATAGSELYYTLPAAGEDHRRDTGRAGDGGR